MKSLLLTCAVCLTTLSSWGWGQKGHDAVAYIAECHLTDTTRVAIDSLLDGKSIVYWANWLDNASHTPQYAYSKTWHYKNIDEDETFESAPTLQSGNIVTALTEQIATLRSSNTSKEDAALALKIIVHLMGDIHQPMHLGRSTDLGGNRHSVKYFNRNANLHSVWDSNLPESTHKWSYTEWQQQIDRANPEQQADIMRGTIEEWAKETHEICKEVYSSTPQETNISYDYIAKWTTTIETQFLRGGLRLSEVLNAIFDPSYRPVSSTVR